MYITEYNITCIEVKRITTKFIQQGEQTQVSTIFNFFIIETTRSVKLVN